MCVRKLCFVCMLACVCVCVCSERGMECIARKVTTLPPTFPSLPRSPLSQMGYSGDGPDRPWFGF